jgi:hypothetical protein
MRPLRAIEPVTEEHEGGAVPTPSPTFGGSSSPASDRAASSPAFGPVVLGRSAPAARGVLGGAPKGIFTAPRNGTVVVVTAVGGAEGSRGAAAALSCAGSGVETAGLLVDVGGRVPRPTLIASASAHRLEERLAARLPALRPAARGEVCHLSVAADEDGLGAAGVAVLAARGGLVVVHVAPDLLQPLLDTPGAPEPDAALLRADLGEARPLVALAVDDLFRRGLRVAVLKRRLGWVTERRAGFGALGSDSGGLPESLVRRLLDAGTRG